MLYQSQSGSHGMCNAVWDDLRWRLTKQLSNNYCWVSSQQSLYMASNVKKKNKSWHFVVRKHLGKDNFVLFSRLFPCLREHCIVYKIKQGTCKLISILVFHFHTISVFFMSKSNRMEPKKCHWWNLKSKGLGWGKPVALATHPYQKDENDD